MTWVQISSAWTLPPFRVRPDIMPGPSAGPSLLPPSHRQHARDGVLPASRFELGGRPGAQVGPSRRGGRSSQRRSRFRRGRALSSRSSSACSSRSSAIRFLKSTSARAFAARGRHQGPSRNRRETWPRGKIPQRPLDQAGPSKTLVSRQARSSASPRDGPRWQALPPPNSCEGMRPHRGGTSSRNTKETDARQRAEPRARGPPPRAITTITSPEGDRPYPEALPRSPSRCASGPPPPTDGFPPRCRSWPLLLENARCPAQSIHIDPGRVTAGPLCAAATKRDFPKTFVNARAPLHCFWRASVSRACRGDRSGWTPGCTATPVRNFARNRVHLREDLRMTFPNHGADRGPPPSPRPSGQRGRTRRIPAPDARKPDDH